MTHRPSTLPRLAPPLLGAIGWFAILLVVGTDAWPALLGWLVGIAAVAYVATTARGRTRVLAGAVFAVACVALTWEGGLFFLPSALALVVLPWRPGKRQPLGA